MNAADVLWIVLLTCAIVLSIIVMHEAKKMMHEAEKMMERGEQINAEAPEKLAPDLISRQAAIEEVRFGITHVKAINVETGEVTELFARENKELQKAIERIKQLPAAQPERKKGVWIFKDHLWECNQCGCRINRVHPLKGNIWNYYYCPNCGADMRGGADDET